jgi:protein-S-isoprenylcysteine O-methyltransferase Ste14
MTYAPNLLAQPWNIFYFICFVAFFVIRGVYARQTRREVKIHRQVDALEKALLLFVIPTSLILPLLYLFTPLLWLADYRLPAFARWCGAALMLVALWLFWRSHADLGQNWSVSLEVRKGHQLVTHGVYQSIRHPMYAAILLWGIAQGLLLDNWLAGWSTFVPFAVMYVLRTPREERMMCEFFGEEYQEYMARTGRLVPRFKRRKETAGG